MRNPITHNDNDITEHIPLRGSKTVVSTLRRALNSARNRRTNAELQILQIEKVLMDLGVVEHEDKDEHT